MSGLDIYKATLPQVQHYHNWYSTDVDVFGKTFYIVHKWNGSVITYDEDVARKECE